VGRNTSVYVLGYRRRSMTEKLGSIVLLIVSVVAVVVLGNDIMHSAGLIMLAIYTMGILGLCGAIYSIMRL